MANLVKSIQGSRIDVLAKPVFFLVAGILFLGSTDNVLGKLPRPIDTAKGEFSIIALPDTQRYSYYNPALFYAQTEWVRENREKLNIRFVIHLGDIVDENTDAEWVVADKAMGTLDGIVPYSVAPGNHDMSKVNGKVIHNSSKFNAIFPPLRFKGKSWYGGHKGVTNENNYCFFSAGGRDFMVVSLEFGPSDETLRWANELLARQRDKSVIVATHCYMYSDDTRVGEGDRYNPHKHDPKFNDGEQMWDKFVRRHENIFLVISGHIKGAGAGRLISNGDQGNPVYQILSNYQMVTNGGNGWLRILTFIPGEEKIYVSTYSPTLDRWNEEDEHDFVVNEKIAVFE